MLQPAWAEVVLGQLSMYLASWIQTHRRAAAPPAAGLHSLYIASSIYTLSRDHGYILSVQQGSRINVQQGSQLNDQRVTLINIQ
jgi:hypothetical protein